MKQERCLRCCLSFVPDHSILLCLRCATGLASLSFRVHPWCWSAGEIYSHEQLQHQRGYQIIPGKGAQWPHGRRGRRAGAEQVSQGGSKEPGSHWMERKPRSRMVGSFSPFRQYKVHRKALGLPVRPILLQCVHGQGEGCTRASYAKLSLPWASVFCAGLNLALQE